MGKKKSRRSFASRSSWQGRPRLLRWAPRWPARDHIMEFCRAYNERTAAQAGMVIPAEITVYEDRSFNFITKTPPAYDLLKKAAGVEKGSAQPNRDKVGPSPPPRSGRSPRSSSPISTPSTSGRRCTPLRARPAPWA